MTGSLRLGPNLPDPDGFYSALIAAHDGLTEAQSALLDARLVLVLANHVGDAAVLAEALEVATSGLGQRPDRLHRGPADDRDPP